MSDSLNKVMLLGTLGQEPEVKELQKGQSLLKLRLVTSERYQDKVTKEWKENSEWHNIVFFSPFARDKAANLHKGSVVLVEGKITTRSYEQNGQKKYVTEIKADTIKNPARAPARTGIEAYGVPQPSVGLAYEDVGADRGDIPF